MHTLSLHDALPIWIGFAIPSNLVVQIATQLIRFGKVKNLWIGNFRVARVKLNRDNKIVDGLKIIEMESLGPLYEKGIRVNDIIIGVNDGYGDWQNLIQSLRFATLGEDLKLEFFTTSNELLTFEFTYEED